MKILLTSTSFQDTPGQHQELLKKQGFTVDILRGPVYEDELLLIIQNYDAVICGDDEYTEEVLKRGKEGNLKYISKYGVGLDKIDLIAAKELGIPVTNCPGVNQVSVAEHVMALILCFQKNIHLQHQTTQNASWKRLIGNEIFGKTIGIIGLGAIGKELAKRANAFGLHVLAFDINKDEVFLNDHKEITFVNDIKEIFYGADIISLHVPHTKQTEHLISKDVIFNELKKAPIIVNTARGKLVDVDGIIEGLKDYKIKGYLTDVLETEPITPNEKLIGVENVIITPHVGSRTYQSVERQGLMAVNNLINMING
ncbi:NAD(P)-dependent oxidoreductase [Winogradskyella sp.]|uniref:NAD(P)-dependent oxidoreductase n=1 Tax=Winogradskyella sp. TaxID=1883156 RepID=UPI0035151B1C